MLDVTTSYGYVILVFFLIEIIEVLKDKKCNNLELTLYSCQFKEKPQRKTYYMSTLITSNSLAIIYFCTILNVKGSVIFLFSDIKTCYIRIPLNLVTNI